MKKLDCVLVVEGKSDVSYLSNYIDAEFIITNGSEISDETINYIKKIKEVKEVVVLVDPDSPGKRIRDILDQNINGLKHCFIRKEFAIKNGKVGVAECEINEIFKALDNMFVLKKEYVESISYSDLYELNLIGCNNSKELRNKLSYKLSLGYVNAKTLYKRLNSLNISKNKIEELLNE
ncbi:MAG: ribonuclease M5 [Bacilli bacterium]|nr:ribonuclease M5 [Bacilli bacterium]